MAGESTLQRISGCWPSGGLRLQLSTPNTWVVTWVFCCGMSIKATVVVSSAALVLDVHLRCCFTFAFRSSAAKQLLFLLSCHNRKRHDLAFFKSALSPPLLELVTTSNSCIHPDYLLHKNTSIALFVSPRNLAGNREWVVHLPQQRHGSRRCPWHNRDLPPAPLKPRWSVDNTRLLQVSACTLSLSHPLFHGFFSMALDSRQCSGIAWLSVVDRQEHPSL